MSLGTMEITPLAETFAAKVTGVRLTDLDDAAFGAIYAAWLERGLLIFPGQYLSREQQVDFAGRFGPIEIAIVPISNVRDDGRLREPDDAWVRVLKGNQGWHIDSTYVPVQSKGAVLSAHVVPTHGGETEWADMAAAYDALPDDLKSRIASLSAHHSMTYSQRRIGDDYRRGPEHGGYGADVPPPLRSLVKRHPETGRRSLIIGRHAFGIPGLATDESEALLDDLLERACQPARIYRHRWTAGDVAVWDNRRTMHRGLAWDLARPRVLYHTRISGDPDTEFAPPG